MTLRTKSGSETVYESDAEMIDQPIAGAGGRPEHFGGRVFCRGLAGIRPRDTGRHAYHGQGAGAADL